ncbi:MAG: T9SS type A sorting domain-containing protein [Bacteroidota bacterium]
MNLLSSTFFLFLIFSIAITQVTFAQGDNCADAQLVESGIYEVDSLVGEGAIFQGATAAAWYRYEPTEKGVFTVSSCGGGADTRLVLFFLDNCAESAKVQLINSVEDNCNDGMGGQTASTAEVVAIPGFSYVIYWDDGQSAKGFTWELTFAPEGINPKGATCATADTIGTGSFRVDSMSGTGAVFLDAVSAKWYAFIPERDGILEVSACASGVNTRLFIWEDGCENGRILSQDDDGCNGNNASQTEENLVVEKDRLYHIYWDDHWTKSGFEFTVTLADIPSNTEEPNWANQVQIFPNPASDFLRLAYDFPTSKTVNLSIYNSLGQLLHIEHDFLSTKGQITFNVSDWQAGYYILRMNSDGSQVTRSFLVVK